MAGSDYKNNIGQINNNGQLIKNISVSILKKKPINKCTKEELDAEFEYFFNKVPCN